MRRLKPKGPKGCSCFRLAVLSTVWWNMSTGRESISDYEPEEQGRGVRSVARALRILKIFGPARPKATLTQISKAAELAPSTTVRLLQTLEEEGFLTRLEDGSYTYGPAILHLGLLARDNIQLVDLAGPHLERTTAMTGETTNLGIPEGEAGVLYIDQRLSSFALRAHSWLGRTVPRAGTAIGAAMQGDVNAEGWTVAATTLEAGVTAVAAPIHDETGEIVGAINITGPTERVLKRAHEFGTYLAGEAASLTHKIGGTWPYNRTASTLTAANTAATRSEEAVSADGQSA